MVAVQEGLAPAAAGGDAMAGPPTEGTMPAVAVDVPMARPP